MKEWDNCVQIRWSSHIRLAVAVLVLGTMLIQPCFSDSAAQSAKAAVRSEVLAFLTNKSCDLFQDFRIPVEAVVLKNVEGHPLPTEEGARPTRSPTHQPRIAPDIRGMSHAPLR